MLGHFNWKKGTQEKSCLLFSFSEFAGAFSFTKGNYIYYDYYTDITKHFALKFSSTVLAGSSWNEISSIACSWTDSTRLLRFQAVIYLSRARDEYF